MTIPTGVWLWMAVVCWLLAAGALSALFYYLSVAALLGVARLARWVRLRIGR